MKRERNQLQRQGPGPSIVRSGWTLARRPAGSPNYLRAFRASWAGFPWRLVLLLTGFLMQVVLTCLVWYLVDLTISLMEVWAELARKHLEIVLS